MTIGATDEDFLQQLIRLTPPGSAFTTESTSNWVKLLSAIAQTCERVDANAVLLLDEAFPDTTTLLLPNWERVAGLPDECSELGDTYEVRRLKLIQKLTSRGGQAKDYFIEVAAALGYTVTITEFRPFRIGISRIGDPLCNEDWWFVWQVNSALNTIIWFRASKSGAGEPLASWGNVRLECIMNKYKPAHTIVQFAYT
jgi:Uncharacterized protein conserved in bacteria